MKLFIGLLIWIVGFILLSIPLGILSIFKILVVTFYARCRSRGATGSENEEILSPLSASDCMFVPDSSWTRPIINVGFVLKIDTLNNESDIFTIENLREHFSSCFLDESIEGGKYEKLLSYVVLRAGYGFRGTKSIDLSEHIFQVKFDDENSKNESLEELLAEWLLTGYKEKKPCWEMILLSFPTKLDGNMKETRLETVVAFKIHHALVDGYSLLHILDKLCGNSSPYLVRDFNESFPSQIRQMIECPAHLSRMSGLPPQSNPFRVTLSKKHEWLVSFTSFPLAELKDFRRKHGVHMASVVLTILVLGLMEFHEKEMATGIASEEICLASTLPWPRHPSRDASLSNKDKLCNHWVSTVFRISLEERNPLHLLKQIENEFQAYHDFGLNKFFKRVLIPLFSTMPNSILDGVLGGKDIGVGAGLTSLVGGDNYILLGHPIKRIHPFLAIHDSNKYMPFSAFTFSHSGRMEVTAGAHPSVFRDQNTFDKILHELCHKQMNTLLTY